MTGAEHVHELFSDAYDRELDAKDAPRFHEHVAGCPGCAKDFRAFQHHIDMLRALPPSRMPVAVHVPAGALGAPLGGRRAWARLSRPGYAAVAAGLVAAAAAVAIAVPLLRSGTSTGAPPAVARTQPPTVQAPSSGAVGAAAPAAGSAPCEPPFAQTVPASPAAAFAAPLGGDDSTAFTNRATATDPSRPGQVLEIATTTTHVAASATVRVLAQLTSPPVGAAAPSTSWVVSPCLTLAVAGQASVGPHAGSALGLAAPAADGALSGARDAAGVPYQQITVPAGLAHGTILVVTATIPHGVPGPGNPPLMARLTVTVD